MYGLFTYILVFVGGSFPTSWFCWWYMWVKRPYMEFLGFDFWVVKCHVGNSFFGLTSVVYQKHLQKIVVFSHLATDRAETK